MSPRQANEGCIKRKFSPSDFDNISSALPGSRGQSELAIVIVALSSVRPRREPSTEPDTFTKGRGGDSDQSTVYLCRNEVHRQLLHALIPYKAQVCRHCLIALNPDGWLRLAQEWTRQI
jgi:hypothetical protein